MAPTLDPFSDEIHYTAPMHGAILLGLAIFLKVMVRDFYPETDNVYQHFLGYRLWASGEIHSLYQDWFLQLRSLSKESSHTAILDLAFFREQMAGVYFLPNSLYYFINRIVRFLGSDPYSHFMAKAIFWSVVGVWALAFTAVILIFERLKEFRQPLLLTLLFLFLSEAAPWRTLSDALTHSFFLPHRDDFVFGFTPRNFFTLLSLGVFALRWSDHSRGAYGLLLLGSLVHTTYAFLLFFTLYPLDCFFHRRVLSDKWVRVLCAVTIVVLLGVEPFVSSRPWWLKGLVLGFVLLPPWLPAGKERKVQELYILLFLVAFCSVPWALSFKTGNSPMEGSALSPLLLDRYRFLLRGGLILALACRWPNWGVKWLPQASVVLAIATILWTVPKVEPAVSRLIYHFEHTYEANPTLAPLHHVDDEGRIYYDLMKRVDTRDVAGLSN